MAMVGGAGRGGSTEGEQCWVVGVRGGGEGVREAFVSGLDNAFLVAGIMLLVGMVISGLHGASRRVPRPSEEDAPESPAS